MTTQELINLGACGIGNSLGFNVSNGCVQNIVAASKFGVFTPGAYFDPSEDFTYEYLIRLMEEGKLDIISGIRSFEENGSDDAVETLEDDTQILTNEGKYKFLAQVTSGLYMNRALHSIKGFGTRQIFYIDKNGNILLTNRQGGGAKGFTTGMTQPGKLQFPSNSVGLKQSLMVQLLERFEIDEEFAFIDRQNLNFNPKTIEGVNQVDLKFVNTPAVGDTTLVFEAKLTQDQKTPLEGADANDIRLVLNDTTSAPTPAAVAGFPGRYTVPVSALSSEDNVSLSLYNTADQRPVINKDTQLYKSQTLIKLVA